MKTGLYDKYYKLGFEHFINKKIMGLHKTRKGTEILYFLLIAFVLVFGNLVI
tara:strand:- start:136115 stop:136270 length:156 start_codon:yes stop_codon:yes gene_type:complete